MAVSVSSTVAPRVEPHRLFCYGKAIGNSRPQDSPATVADQLPHSGPVHARVNWKKLCLAVESIERERTPDGFLSRSLEQVERLVPFDHALAVLTIGRAVQIPAEEAAILRAYELPFSVDDGKLHQVCDESYGRRLFLAQYSPAGFWDEYFSHKGRTGWRCFSIEPSPSLPRLEVVNWLDWASRDGTEIGCFIRKHDSKYVFSLCNYADAGASRFRFCLYRSHRSPFTESEIAAVFALFPHLHNLCVAMADPEASSGAKARAAAAAAGLTRREQDVAVLLSERLSIGEIAERLFISRHTVEKHVEHIHGKLNASGKREVRQRLLGEP